MKVYCICIFYDPPLSDIISWVRECVNSVCKCNTSTAECLMYTNPISTRNCVGGKKRRKTTTVDENYQRANN
jgi:hypothetical protein